LVLIKGFPFVHRSFDLFLKKCEVNLLFSVICQYPSDPFILFAVIAFSDKLPLLIQQMQNASFRLQSFFIGKGILMNEWVTLLIFRYVLRKIGRASCRE